MTSPVQKVGTSLWDLAITPVRGGIGAVQGTMTGTTVAREALRTGAALNLATGATGGATISEIVCNFLRNTFSSLFGNGIHQIGKSGIKSAVWGLLKGINPATLGAVSTAFKGLGAAGLALLGANVIVAGIAIVGGISLFRTASNLADRDSLGWPTEPGGSVMTHGAEAAFGLATAIGGAVSLFNAPLGLATIALGFVGSKVIDWIKWYHDTNSFNTPEIAPWWSRWFFRPFQKQSLGTSIGV